VDTPPAAAALFAIALVLLPLRPGPLPLLNHRVDRGLPAAIRSAKGAHLIALTSAALQPLVTFEYDQARQLWHHAERDVVYCRSIDC
jgi:hypothetical protein